MGIGGGKDSRSAADAERIQRGAVLEAEGPRPEKCLARYCALDFSAVSALARSQRGR
jgi:hypothetical protein